MSVKQECVSLETAKELRRQGYAQRGRHFWIRNTMYNKWELAVGIPIGLRPNLQDENLKEDKIEYFVAPTAQELSRLLVDKIVVEGDTYFIRLYEIEDTWFGGYADSKGNILTKTLVREDSLAEILGTLYLIIAKEEYK